MRYMSAAEVKEIMRRAWQVNGDVLNLMYVTHTRLGAKQGKHKGRAAGLGTLVSSTEQIDLGLALWHFAFVWPALQCKVSAA